MGEETWSCPFCTFENDGWSRICVMCDSLRPTVERLFSRRQTPTSNNVESFALHLYERSNSLREFIRRNENVQFSICNIPSLMSRAFSGAVTSMFAIVGAFTGAVTGAIVGRTTYCGVIRAAGLGAMAGAVLSIELLEASRAYLNSQNLTVHSSMGSIMEDVLSGRFIEEHIGPAMLRSHAWQVNIDDMSYEELYEMFGPGGASKGFSEASLKQLPCQILTQQRLDLLGGVCCTICLQDLQLGETARSLPHCKHTFHMDCLDKWLSRNGSCPMCRQLV